MTTTTSIAIIAIVAALALLGVVIMVTLVNIPQQQAYAKGCTNASPGTTPVFGTAVNASKGRCFHP